MEEKIRGIWFLFCEKGQVFMNTKEVTKENKMGVMPVNQLLISMSAPMMISMLVQALYNVVDSVFVSRINENALTAVSLAFPLQSLMIALGTGTGVGINALLSRSLGEKDFHKADRVAVNAVFLAAVSYLIFLLIGILAVGPFYASQTDDAQILAYGREYLTVVCCFSFGMYGQFVFERLLQSTGKTFYTMITQGSGAVINIILDPILIFGYLGFPEMGVKGAAVATVIGQIIAAVFAFFVNKKKNTEIHLAVRGFKPDLRIIGQIYAVGVPFYYHAGDRFGHDIWNEPDSDCIQLHCGCGFRSLFQTAELYLYAGIRTEQRNGADYCLQLWSGKEGQADQDHKAEYQLCGWHYGGGISDIPDFSPPAFYAF